MDLMAETAHCYLDVARATLEHDRAERNRLVARFQVRAQRFGPGG